MTISLRSWYPTANTPGLYVAGEASFGAADATPRYCASCGCKLRAKNRARICNPCEDRAAAAHYKRQAWLHERGLL